MRNIISVVSLLLFLSLLNFAGDGKKYGKEITLTEKTKISTILSDPESFVGKTVLVEGTIIKVCEKRGCWIELASDKEQESIRIKVNDGEIVFPLESKGKSALVQGEVYSVVIPNETQKKENDAENKGDKEDHENCQQKTQTGDTVYLIKGIGAVIK